MKKNLLFVFFALGSFFLTVILYVYKIDPFASFALRFNDVEFVINQKKISPKVVFVAVDEPSVNRFGRWPWNRSVLAKGIKQLSKADVVLMDMIFSEPTAPQEDSALADALGSLNNSVCGFFLRKNATQTITDEELDLLSDSALDLLQSQVAKDNKPQFLNAMFAEMNIVPIMQECSLNGSFTTIAAKDHLFRSYPVAVYFQDNLYPSLAVQGLRLYFNSDIKKVDDTHLSLAKKTFEVSSDGLVRLNFYHLNQYKIISFLDLYNGKIEPTFFKGKIVILGITEVGAGDVAATPIGNIPGPLLHYTFLSNFLQGDIISTIGKYFYFVILFFALIPLFNVLWIKNVLLRSFINISSYILFYCIALYLFATHAIFIDMFYPLLALLFSLISIEVVSYTLQQKDEKFIKDAFSSYLSNDLMQQLLQNPQTLSLGGEKKELTILFSDIRSFTTISESITPEELITLLNRYFTPMTNAILEKQGMLDKYIGDAIMAFFNAPVDVKNHPDRACEAALLMLERLDELNKALVAEKMFPIHIGIGINTAEVVVGNMGSDTRFNYTVIGDGVNLASRVEGLTKNYGVTILITEYTVKKLTQPFLYREIEPVIVKGKEKAVLLYQLMQDTPTNRMIKQQYQIALEKYKENDLSQAKALFATIVKEYDDSVSKYFIQQIQNDHHWGVVKMKTK